VARFLKGLLRRSLILLLLVAPIILSAETRKFDVDVMGPLTIGDPYDLNDENSQKEWVEFEKNLQVLKRYGIDGVTIDIWWGVVQSGSTVYNWEYYDKVDEVVKRVGMKWVPIFSFHQLGENVNDPKHIPLPPFVLALAQSKGYLYKDAKGKESYESVSVWATDKILYLYKNFFSEFKKHFQGRSEAIKQIYIGLGPAGELRYPSYNKDTYPGYGDLWAYSNLAKAAFKDFVLKKYNYDLIAVAKAWGRNFVSDSDILPPNSVPDFFNLGGHLTEYGKDFFDFYHSSLIEHMKKVVGVSIEVFKAEGSELSKTPLSIKIPGVHWTISADINNKRLAELMAGLITTSSPYFLEPSEAGAGYDDIFLELKKLSPDMVLDFTCIEKSDNEDPKAYTMPKSLTKWIAATAKRHQLKLEGENALPTFGDPVFWPNIYDAMNSGYEELTLLRMDDILSDDNRKVALEGISEITKPDFTTFNLSPAELAIISFLDGEKIEGLNEGMDQVQRNRLIVNEGISKLTRLELAGKRAMDVVKGNMELLFGSGDLVTQYLTTFVYGESNYDQRIANLNIITHYTNQTEFLLDVKSPDVMPYSEKIKVTNKKVKTAELWVKESPKLELIKKYYVEYMLNVKRMNVDGKDLLESVTDLKMEIIMKTDEMLNSEYGRLLLFGTPDEKGMDGLLYYFLMTAKKITDPDTRDAAIYQNLIMGRTVISSLDKDMLREIPEIEKIYATRVYNESRQLERAYSEKADRLGIEERDYIDVRLKEVERVRVRSEGYLKRSVPR